MGADLPERFGLSARQPGSSPVPRPESGYRIHTRDTEVLV